MDERDHKAMNEELNQPSLLGAVSGSLLSRVYEIEFGNHLKAKIKVTNNQIEVEAAMNGWGNGVPLTEVVILELQ